MTVNKTNDDLAREIEVLREELRQMREIVGALLSMVIEEDEDEDGASLFPGNLELPRLNN
jgi:hypothetical protein